MPPVVWKTIFTKPKCFVFCTATAVADELLLPKRSITTAKQQTWKRTQWLGAGISLIHTCAFVLCWTALSVSSLQSFKWQDLSKYYWNCCGGNLSWGTEEIQENPQDSVPTEIQTWYLRNNSKKLTGWAALIDKGNGIIYACMWRKETCCISRTIAEKPAGVNRCITEQKHSFFFFFFFCSSSSLFSPSSLPPELQSIVDLGFEQNASPFISVSCHWIRIILFQLS